MAANDKVKASDLERIPIEQVFEQLKCNKEGLTSIDGDKRLQIFGPNKLEANKMNMVRKFSWIRYTYKAILICAALHALYLAYLYGHKPRDWNQDDCCEKRDWQDLSSMITLLVLYSTLHLIEHLVEENCAHKAAAAMMAGLGLAPKTMVLRDGTWSEQDAAILVPGDIICIKLGDIVPADVRLLEQGGRGGGEELKIDQSALTEELLLVTKKPGDEVFSGSTCKQGELDAVVIATGVHTFSAKTGSSREDQREPRRAMGICWFAASI